MLISRTRESAALIPVLQGMGVPRDGVLVVHSAIAALSRQGFRAEAMIEAFLEYLEKGTLVMPTMTWRSVTPQKRVWDELKTPSETGVMTEIFRTRYASRRSIHPTHSVAAHGVMADILVARHHLSDTPVSADSPYGLMRPYGSHVLMIGVGLEACTAIHLPEEAIAPDVYLRPLDRSELYRCIDRTGHVHEMYARRHLRLDRDFPKFGPALAARGSLHIGEVAGCGCMIVRLQDLLQDVSHTLCADNMGTLSSNQRNLIAPAVT